LGLGHPTATSSAGSASPSFSSAVGFAGSTMSSPDRALTASGPGRGRAPHGQVAFYSTLNEARNLVETPRIEAQRFGLGVNGVLLREWSSPSMDRNAGGRPPERIDRRPLRCVTSSSSARMRAAARPRSASSSGPAEIEGATTGAGPDSPGVHVPSVWPLTWTTVGSRRRTNVFRNSELARASMHRTIPASTSWYQRAPCSAHPRGPVGAGGRAGAPGLRLTAAIAPSILRLAPAVVPEREGGNVAQMSAEGRVTLVGNSPIEDRVVENAGGWTSTMGSS
jgi:hypothetical protein